VIFRASVFVACFRAELRAQLRANEERRRVNGPAAARAL